MQVQVLLQSQISSLVYFIVTYKPLSSIGNKGSGINVVTPPSGSLHTTCRRSKPPLLDFSLLALLGIPKKKKAQKVRTPPTATPPCRETGDIRYTKGKKCAKVRIPPCRETSDILYTKEKKAQKVRTPPWRPPRARGGPQQQHLLAEKQATSDIPKEKMCKSENTFLQRNGRHPIYQRKKMRKK